MSASSLIISLSFLLWLSLTTIKPSSLAIASEEPVNDVNGEALVPGQEYYIVSAIWGAGGGGVKPEKTGDPCSYSILQSSFDLDRGTPVKFNIVEGTNSKEIYAGSTDLEIEFVKKPDCAESSKWVVAYEPGSSPYSLRLVIGGPKDHPHSEFVRGVFRIEKISVFIYKLVFCPERNIVPSSSSTCIDVGIDYRQDGRYLVAANQDSGRFFTVVFFKAESSDKGKFSII